jgi:hypothetical protein
MNTLITVAAVLLILSLILIGYFMFENQKAVSKFLNRRKTFNESIELEKYSKAS